MFVFIYAGVAVKHGGERGSVTAVYTVVWYIERSALDITARRAIAQTTVDIANDSCEIPRTPAPLTTVLGLEMSILENRWPCNDKGCVLEQFGNTARRQKGLKHCKRFEGTRTLLRIDGDAALDNG